MRKPAKTSFVFLFVCLLGAIVMHASGITWGTANAGVLVGCTFFFAGMAALLSTISE